MRKLVGTLTMVAAAIVGGINLLQPIEISVLGTTISCGIPVVAGNGSTDSATDPVTAACTSKAKSRVMFGAAVLVGGLFAGLLVGFVGRQPDRPAPAPPPPPPPPGWWLDGEQ